MATSEKLVAIITGGANGIGFDVAKRLAITGLWNVHILDLDVQRGSDAVKSLGPTTVAEFHAVNLLDYKHLQQIFGSIFDNCGQVNFVFANAGIIEPVDFYSTPSGKPEQDEPPLDQTVIDINLKSVVNTAYLAQRYFKVSPEGVPKNLIMTASVGSLYPCFSIPMYTAAKHGVLGFMRAIVPNLAKQGVRVNAILPGAVATNLMTKEDLLHYPQDALTPVDVVSRAVVQVLNMETMVDAKGVVVEGPQVYGKAIEVNVQNFYFRDQPEWCDDAMRRVMATTEHSYHSNL